MNNMKYSWQNNDWERFRGQLGRLPHGILFHGMPDIGKRDFASAVAQSLLCENRAADGSACGQCQACGWFVEGNHPDYREILPEALQPEPSSDTDQGGTASAAKTKTPSREIKIDQIRQLDGFFAVGTHRGGSRVALIYPAEVMTVAASNALLKTLEEPGPETVFLLVTSHLDQLLPTIRSRTTQFGLTRPTTEQSIGWLKEQGVKDAERRLARAGGTPLGALRESTEETAADEHEALVAALAGGRFDPVSLAEKCDKAGNEKLALWLQRWVADLLLVGQQGGAPRYHPERRAELDTQARSASAVMLHGLYRRLADARRVAAHPLNPRLFAEELLMDIARILAQTSSRPSPR